MKDKKYSEEQYEFLSSFENIENYDMVIDIYGGFGTDLTDVIDTFFVNLAFEQGEEQKSWAQIRSEYGPVVNSTLEQYE